MTALIEKKAMTKWCPFVRLRLYATGGAQNRGEEVGERAKCIASACMAWRWTITPGMADHENKNSNLGAASNVMPSGYCGLAGKP